MGHVNYVGVEMEGGWSKKSPDPIIIGDESVKLHGKENTMKIWKHYGEKKSPKLKPEEVEKFIRDHHPEGVNWTCGLHVHVSFRDRPTYERTVTERFFNYFYSEIERFQETYHPTHKLFALRIKGEAPHGVGCLKECCVGRFCQRKFQPFDQMQIKVKDHNQNAIRRTGINWAYNTVGDDGKPRKTVEIRLLPQFETADHTVQAVKKVISIFNKFLATEPLKRPRLRKSVEIMSNGKLTDDEDEG